MPLRIPKLPSSEALTQHLRSENQNLTENMERLRNEIAEISHVDQGRGASGISKVSCGRRTKEQGTFPAS